MDLQAINLGSKTQVSSKNEHQETIKRVQTEFLSQVMEGKDEKTAFKESLKAIDEKYNPQEDEFKTSNKEAMGHSSDFLMYDNICARKNMMKSFKMPDAKTILAWLTFISEALPILLDIINKLPKPEPKPEPMPEPIPDQNPNPELNQVA